MADVPLYYLHVHNSAGEALDQEGLDLPDLEAARAQALDGIRSILSDEVRYGKADLRGRVEIADQDGEILLVVRFDEAVTVLAGSEGA